jgi:uracil-DNA glycosylase
MAMDATPMRARAKPAKSPATVEEGERGDAARQRPTRVGTPVPKPIRQQEARSQHAATLAAIAASARACRICEAHLPLGPRPVFRVSTTARLLIVGQAPGTKVHESGIPWNDPSGDRLRRWLQMDRDTFYDEARIAIVPMGLCYPGRLRNGGDAPPRPECAPLWRERLVSAMPNIRLTLLIGIYALTHTLGPGAMTDHVRAFRDGLPRYFPLPHPSWRTVAWERKNPWFETEVLPALRASVAATLC